ncbi:hypothetical protein NMG60_11009667 [Bertholletia excelsa]
MEEDQVLRHVCRFCSKSFFNGRSLGGHMRSHLISSSETDQEKRLREKLSCVSNGGEDASKMVTEGGSHASCKLREKPKKSPKFADSDEGSSLHDKLCKECGKGFQSFKALFGHMKCHSEKFSISSCVDDEDSWVSANQKPLVERKKRSRRVIRYTSSSSLFLANNVSSSVSETEQETEQEEIAMCLIMLSRGLGNKSCGFNSITESSDNNFELLEVRASVQNNEIAKAEENSSWSDEAVKFKKLRNGKLEPAILRSELGASGFPGFRYTRNKSEPKNSKYEDGCGLEASEVESSKNLIKESELDQAEFISQKQSSEKLKYGGWDAKKFKSECTRMSGLGSSEFSRNKYKLNKSEVEFFGRFEASEVEMGKNMMGENDQNKRIKFECTGGSELGAPGISRNGNKLNKSEIGSFGNCGPKKSKHEDGENDQSKRIKYQCKSCNKSFHSKQALGGHKASHKKISHDPTSREQELLIGQPGKAKTSLKKIRGHECPICFKVFPTGQALGGHKRSHLIGGSEGKTSKNSAIQEPVAPEIRDLLDLNMPAPVEEESIGDVGFRPFWSASSQKHEALLGLHS